MQHYVKDGGAMFSMRLHSTFYTLLHFRDVLLKATDVFRPFTPNTPAHIFGNAFHSLNICHILEHLFIWSLDFWLRLEKQTLSIRSITCIKFYVQPTCGGSLAATVPHCATFHYAAKWRKIVRILECTLGFIYFVNYLRSYLQKMRRQVRHI